jgi:peptidoglycan/LPS O-acetylase OafA/YrhL
MRSKNIAYNEKLDHLRLLAAWWVIVFHSNLVCSKILGYFPVDPYKNYSALGILAAQGNTGVTLFLTLSGFLFTRICLNKVIDVKAFYRNRLLRVYPLYLVVVLLGASTTSDQTSFSSLLTSLFCLQGSIPGVASQFTAHLWTVGVEVHFYILFPLLLLMTRKYGRKYLFGLMVLSLIGLSLVYTSCPEQLRNVSYLTIFGRINQFLIGMLIGMSYDRLKDKWQGLWAIPLALVGMALALTFTHSLGDLALSGKDPRWIIRPTIEGLACGLLILAYSATRYELPKRLSAILAAGGELSYSLYITHYPIFFIVIAWLGNFLREDHHWGRLAFRLQHQLCMNPPLTAFLGGSLLVLPVTIFVSIFTFNLIEKPLMELRTRYVFSPEGGEPANIANEQTELSLTASSSAPHS